jgi:flagellum-specific peptidoglycan hydrolase FlgJ
VEFLLEEDYSPSFGQSFLIGGTVTGCKKEKQMASAEQLAARAKVVKAAQSSQIAYGVPASITLAQWEVESTWGTSQLAIKANNFFGIKAEHLNDPDTYIEFPTAEYINGKRVMIDADFEKYPDIESSFKDHARLLSTATRYQAAMDVKNDSLEFAEQLQVCGYSTSPTYAQTLVSIIKGSNLQQYDIAGE